MERTTQSPAQVLTKVEAAQNGQGLFSSESVLNILKLIFAGSPLPEVLTIMRQTAVWSFTCINAIRLP